MLHDMTPWISDRYKADTFPVPRYYDTPASSSTTAHPSHHFDWLPRLHTFKTHRAVSPPASSASSSPPASPTSSTSSFSSSSSSQPHAPTTASISAAPHKSSHFLPAPFARIQRHIQASRRALALSQAESVERFPDASGATRTKPLIQGQRHCIRAVYYGDTDEVRVSGNLLAIAAGFRVEVWRTDCEVGQHGVAAVMGGSPCTSLCWSQSGRYLWVGTLGGALFEFDTAPFTASPSPLTPFPCVAHRQDAHPSGTPIVKIHRVDSDKMYTLDSSGRLVIWLPDEKLGRLVSLHAHSKVLQLPPDFDWVEVLDGRVWASWMEFQRADGGPKHCVVRVYDVDGPRGVMKGEQRWAVGISDQSLGKVTSACIVPSHPGFAFLGHDSGHISVWKEDGSKMLEIVKVSLAKVTAVCGPSRYLWIGYSDGMVDVMDVAGGADWPVNWRVVKRFRAHASAVVTLQLDSTSLWTASSLRVMSSGADLKIKFWDGLLRDDWLVKRMSSVIDSYCTFTPLKLGIFTWNTDGQSPDLLQSKGKENQTLLQSFLGSLDNPDLVVFNFQELIDLSDLTLAARTILFATQKHDVTGRYRHWHAVLIDAVKLHLGADFKLVQETKLVGLYQVVFAKKSVKNQIRNLASHRIKAGFDEVYGNKGSIMTRLVINDSSFCFVNSHLAAGKTHPAERERDLITILDGRAGFPRPSANTQHAYLGGGDGTTVSDCEMVFFAGDLNFRIDMPRQQVLDTVSQTPSPQRAISTLLPHDELTTLRKTNPSFRLRSFQEAPICFFPTYKYDHFSNEYDTSAKQRTPSWCDRVLWRSERKESVKPVSYGRFEANISDHRPVAAIFEVQVRKVDPLRSEWAYRDAVHAWATEAEKLLQIARTYYPPEA
ncbi:hypothetical protein JCM11641_002152 [Rhodosporidiobolus odoratus]